MMSVASNAISTGRVLSISEESMKWLLKAVVAGALLWIAINLVAMGYQPARVGSIIANIEIGLSLVVAILARLVLRWP
jgi:hypothetical protein